MQHVVKTLEASSFFDGDETVRLFDYANDRAITRRRRAKPAGICFGKIVTGGTENYAVLNFTERRDEALDFSFRRPHQMKGEPLRRLVPNARPSLQLVDQLRYWFCVF